MPEKVDLYNTSYASGERQVYSDVRRETYGQDLGQTSWCTLEEFAETPRLLGIEAGNHILEIGCGVGGCALRFAATIGCQVTGIDLNAHGIRVAEEAARSQQLAERVIFQEHDASRPLPFAEQAFDAAYSNDAFCHIPNRPGLLRECKRVLKPGGRLLFSDALVVSGLLTSQEMATRSSIGYYLFAPRGENERLIGEAGLTLLHSMDTTQQAATIAQRWREARARRKDALLEVEGEQNFEGLQQFLGCVHELTAQGRLARFVYVAGK